MFLVVEEGVWRDVEEVNVGDVVRGFSEWAFVWGPGDHDVTGKGERVRLTSCFLGIAPARPGSTPRTHTRLAPLERHREPR